MTFFESFFRLLRVGLISERDSGCESESDRRQIMKIYVSQEWKKKGKPEEMPESSFLIFLPWMKRRVENVSLLFFVLQYCEIFRAHLEDNWRERFERDSPRFFGYRCVIYMKRKFLFGWKERSLLLVLWNDFRSQIKKILTFHGARNPLTRSGQLKTISYEANYREQKHFKWKSTSNERAHCETRNKFHFTAALLRPPVAAICSSSKTTINIDRRPLCSTIDGEIFMAHKTLKESRSSLTWSGGLRGRTRKKNKFILSSLN